MYTGTKNLVKYTKSILSLGRTLHSGQQHQLLWSKNIHFLVTNVATEVLSIMWTVESTDDEQSLTAKIRENC